MKRAINLFSWLILIVFYAVMGLFIYWSIRPYRVLEFQGETFPVTTKSVRQGGYVAYTSNFCKYTDLPATVSRSFVNGIIFNTPSTTTNRQEGCHQMSIRVIVPPELIPGLYHIEIIYEYQVNPIRKVTIKRSTDNFNVTE